MQAAARAAIQEIARGVSTGLVVLAGTQTPQCTCICPACPDCNCLGSQRVYPAAPTCTANGVSVLVGFVLGLIVGLFCLVVSAPCRGIEVVVPPSRARIEEISEEVDAASVARR